MGNISNELKNNLQNSQQRYLNINNKTIKPTVSLYITNNGSE